MGLLSSLAKASARASGRALARHVLPDSLVPSWKTQRTLETGYSLLKKAGKKKKAKPTSSTRSASPKRPAPRPPKQKFDKNAWSQGRGLPSGVGYGERPPSRPKSSFLSSAKVQASKLRRQSVDLARNPRIAAQMGLDLLREDYRVKKQSFLSELKGVKASITFKKK